MTGPFLAVTWPYVGIGHEPADSSVKRW